MEQKICLTVRELQITNEILNTTIVIKAQDLANKFQVSLRTVKYDLKKIKEWFDTQGVPLISQPNKGYWIECDSNKVMEMRNELYRLNHTQVYPDQKTRINRILILLGFRKQPITAEELANVFQVSRNTILGDMISVSTLAENWSIEIAGIKKRGYLLFGDEEKIRKMLENLIMTFLNNYEIYRLTERIMGTGTEYHFYSVLDRQISTITHNVEENISEYFKNSKIIEKKSTDFLILFIRIIISLKRMQLGFTLGSYQIFEPSKLLHEPGAHMVHLLESVYQDASLPLLKNEYLYCVGNKEMHHTSVDTLEMTEYVIRYVSEKEELPFLSDSKLHDSLLAHLSSVLGRSRGVRDESNPINDEIKKHNQQLFQHVSEACSKYVALDQAIEETFVSPIVLHFLVSLEELRSIQKKVRTLYVCSTGRGVARLIKYQLEAHIKNIQLVAYCSIMDVDRMCRKYEIDLIVSIFPIKSSIHVAVIPSWPQHIDYLSIQNEVDQILKEIPDNRMIPETDKSQMLLNSSEKVNEEIIIKGFEVYRQMMIELSDELNQERVKGLLLHILLMVNRYYFNKQYDLVGAEVNPGISEKILPKIRGILEKNQLYLGDPEFFALLQYFVK